MTVKEYNTVHHPKINNAVCFVSCLEHAVQKSGAYNEVMRQLGVIGWSDECRDTIKAALSVYREHLVEQIDKATQA